RNRRSFAYVGNAVGAIAAVLRPTMTASGVFFASDDRDLSTAELIRAIAHALGRPARLVAVPRALLEPLAWFSPAVARLVGSLAVDPSALTKAAGFSPRFTLEEGLERTARWYRDRPRRTT
ncbi:MAG: NAD-dependent epimerase/dehydratase family protein, partial [Gemmatimonadales bacterium]